MRAKFVGIVAAALLAVAAFSAASASAATEFGDNCVANQVTALGNDPLTLFAFTATSDPLPLPAPSSGIITSWKLNQTFGPIATPLALKVLRQTGPSNVQVLGESAPAIPTIGPNTFDTRIPVQAGDRLGLFGEGNELPFCQAPGEENEIGLFEGAAVGANVEFFKLEAEEARIPVAAVIEPDADADGFGDETQDKCPQNAAVQAPCPVIPPVALSTTSVAKKGLVTVLITSNAQAPVTVNGTVKVNKKGKPAKLNGGTQIVAPGTIAKFTLLFPQALKAKLKSLSPKQSLSLDVTGMGTNSAGVTSTSNLKVKLKGQAKPEHHSKAKAKPKAQA
jgi:hypothetical protein